MIEDPTQAAQLFVDRLKKADTAVVLTGAGVSTDSGIPDFRGPTGLYSTISARTFDIDYFHEFPADYYQTAIEHIHTLADKQPNTTHIMLSRLEAVGLIRAVITQNIDGLHLKAGSKNVIEFHGDVARFHCIRCQKEYNRTIVDAQILANNVPACDACGGLIRPGIVFFGDPIPMDALSDAHLLAQTADLFIAVGSSLSVNPAASLAVASRQTGAELWIVNRGETALDALADMRIHTDLAAFSQNVLSRLDASA